MDCTCIAYTRVPNATPLLTDYLYHFDRLSQFYSGPPFELASYRAISSELRSTREHRRALTDILARQNKALGSGEATFKNIDRLSDPATFAVVTGQQVALASGPAFTLYKALTAVRLAQSLSDQGLPALPVFWLATEDHDLEEVAKVATFDGEYDLVTLNDPGERPAPRSSVGFVKLTSEINSALQRLEGALPPGEFRERLLLDLRECYRPGISWGGAFGRLVARLFSRWGVILVDPLDDAIHQMARVVYEQALVKAAELRARVQKRSQALIRAGYHAQVHVADDSTLLFAARGGNRLPVHQLTSQSAAQGDGLFSLEEAERASLQDLTAQIESRPLDFTPNALLRPIVQDTLFPTLAYVAGPAELAYLGQAQAIYALSGRPMPVVFPRAAFTLVDRKTRRLMDKYHLNVQDAWKGEEQLSRKIAAVGFGEGGTEGWAERFDQTEQDLRRLIERLRQDVERLDATLLDALKHAEEKIAYQIERLRGKLSRAALERSDLLARHQQALLKFLAPRRSLQEREVGGVYFLGCAGYDLLDRLLNQIQIRSSDHQVVDY